MMPVNNEKLIKNYLPNTLIEELYRNCFKKETNNLEIQKLHGGMKNAVYLIQNNNEKVVLKVAQKKDSKTISVDKNNMWWEARMLKLMESFDIPAPKLILFDDTGELCSEEYIFMSYIPGQVYSKVKDNLTDKEKGDIEFQIGRITSTISSIKGEHYFLPSHPHYQFKNNYDFVYNLFNLLINDIDNNVLNDKIIMRIYDILWKNKNNLNNVNEISLCNTDLWDGNILIENGNISGIVDFSDLYFCDKLMTFYFHTIDGATNKRFLQGFNKKNLSSDENARIEIYRLYVILKMIVDCEIKNYGRFDWMYQILETSMNVLEKRKIRK